MSRHNDHEPEYDYLFVKVIKWAKSKKSVLCELPDFDDEQLWIPCSVMEHEGRDLTVGDEEDLSVEKWFLRKNDIDNS